MKSILPLLALVSTPLLSAQELTLKPGSDVTPEALAAASWIQGDAPKGWEDGALYVIECWATWCGPCLAAIPHVNGLHSKYARQGLRVLGISVWEDDEAKVREFVTGKGDGMSYPVAFARREGPFVKSWLEAAGVKGIPHTFVVKDGKLLFTTHPMSLSEELIETLLAGGEAAQMAVAIINKQKEGEEMMRALLQQMQQASAEGDAAKLQAILAQIEELDPGSPSLPMLRLELDMAREDWESAAGRLDKMEGEEGVRTIASFAYRVTQMPSSFPEAFRKALSARLDSLLEDDSARDSFACVMLAGLRLTLDHRDAAIAAAKMAAEAAGTDVPRQPLDRFVEELEAGNSPTPDVVLAWVREAMNAPDNRAERNER